MKFTKMHGCGNDYVYVNMFEEHIDNPAEMSIKVSDRHFGIGSDGLITIEPSDIADFRMRIYNADGSEAEMCGNGIRCVAKYVYDHKLTDKTEISVQTGAGVKILKLFVEGDKVEQVTVDMGEPVLAPAEIPVVADGDRVVDEPIEETAEESDEVTSDEDRSFEDAHGMVEEVSVEPSNPNEELKELDGWTLSLDKKELSSKSR